MADSEYRSFGANLHQTLRTHRGTIVSLGLLIAAGFGANFAWQASNSSVVHSPRYQVTTTSITISQQPNWLHADVKLEALSRSGLLSDPTNGKVGVSIIDPTDQLEERVATAFEFHPWIQKVTKVTKSPPNQLVVEVEYRRPVAVLSTTAKEANQIPYYPIDEEGVLLPQKDLSPKDLGLLPRIDIKQFQPSSTPSGLQVGQRWTEPRIAGAVDIIRRLDQRWHSLELLDIRPSTVPEIRGNQRYYLYELRSDSGTKILWGAAPAYAPSGEHSFEDKLARLESYVASSGNLGSVHSSPAFIDVRTKLQTQPRLVKKENGNQPKTRTASAPEKEPKKTASIESETKQR